MPRKCRGPGTRVGVHVDRERRRPYGADPPFRGVGEKRRRNLNVRRARRVAKAVGDGNRRGAVGHRRGAGNVRRLLRVSDVRPSVYLVDVVPTADLHRDRSSRVRCRLHQLLRAAAVRDEDRVVVEQDFRPGHRTVNDHGGSLDRHSVEADDAGVGDGNLRGLSKCAERVPADRDFRHVGERVLQDRLDTVYDDVPRRALVHQIGVVDGNRADSRVVVDVPDDVLHPEVTDALRTNRVACRVRRLMVPGRMAR